MKIKVWWYNSNNDLTWAAYNNVKDCEIKDDVLYLYDQIETLIAIHAAGEWHHVRVVTNEKD